VGAPAEEFGPYLVYEQLGLGGMATVHRAETKGIAGFSKQVALKRMLPNVAADATLVKSFIREARLASSLRHANVAQTYDLGKVGNIYFIAMELVPGRNLREILKHCAAVVGHMPLPIAMNIVNQICDALDYAHNLCDDSGQPLGIIHRDVSPSNVIVSEGGVVKLIDFGIAKVSAKGMNTQSGTIKGKFSYMAPEYLMGSIDARADLFALGVIAHELLSNRPLFQGKDDMDTLYRVKDMPILPPSRFNAKVPSQIDQIVMTALDRNPEQRWQRAHAMHTALLTETKRLGLVAPNSQVIDWIEWAFQQRPGMFDGESQPVISISKGTEELPRDAQAALAARTRDPIDDDDQDALETVLHTGSQAGGLGQHDWPPAGGGGMKPPQVTGDDTRLIRSRTSQPELRQRDTPSSVPVEDRATVLAPYSSGPLDPDLVNTLPPPGRASNNRLGPDLVATVPPPGRRTPPEPSHQAQTMLADPNMAKPPQHQARTMLADPSHASVPSAANYAVRSFEVPQRNTPSPLPGQPGYIRTLPGQGASPAAVPQLPQSPVLSGIKTSPHLPKRRSSPSGGGIDDLGARGERPAANKLPVPTIVKTNVAKRPAGGNNFVLAVLVLLAAGIAAAVVYFALPYIT
jgi:serine/threonine protein kinase